MNNNLPEKYVERLLEAISRKYKLLEEILRLTREQSGVINEDGIENLEKLVFEKQKVIEEVDKLDEAFNIYFQRIKHELKVESLDEAQNLEIKGLKELQQTVRQVISLINEISAIEKQNNDNAKNLLNSFRNELIKINQGKMVKQVYDLGAAQPLSYFIDKKK